MATAMQVILLERIDNLGGMGETVRVKPGYARNFLLPQGKALRATKANIAYFESQKSALEKVNAEKRAEAEKRATKLKGVKVTLIRHASEGGQLYGGVTSRDIADAITAQGKETVARNQVVLNTAIKTIGLFPITIALHPEVKIEVTANVARSEDEAKIQAETGKALIATREQNAQANDADDAKAAFLEDSALETEREIAEEEAEEEAEKKAKAEKKAARKSAKAVKDEDGEDADAE